jgi:hypothetical protein
MQEKLSTPPDVCIVESKADNGDRIYAVWNKGKTGPYSTDALMVIRDYINISAMPTGANVRGLDSVILIPVWRDGKFTTLLA